MRITEGKFYLVFRVLFRGIKSGCSCMNIALGKGKGYFVFIWFAFTPFLMSPCVTAHMTQLQNYHCI